jgi:phosphate transport system substrate-binding protein
VACLRRTLRRGLMAAVNVSRGVAVAACALALSCDDSRAEREWTAVRETVSLRGVGATVPKALFAKWQEQYAMVEPTTRLAYDAQGSGAGVRVAEEGSADFGVSDTPLSDEDAARFTSVRHLPLAVEAIAIVYSLQGVTAGHLQITEDVLADMLTGGIAWWDDGAIAALNPGIKLPHVPVHVVFRDDESGTSFLLSEWLSKTSKRWSLPVSRSLKLAPALAIHGRTGLSAQKDDGMVSGVRAYEGGLGYLSAVTALDQHLPTLAVRNAAGRFVIPSLDGMRSAAASAQLGGNLRAHAIAGPGDLAYPICSFTFVLVPEDGPDGPRRRALARFLWWAAHEGQRFAPQLGFGALPGELAVRDEEVLRSLMAQGQPAL